MSANENEMETTQEFLHDDDQTLVMPAEGDAPPVLLLLPQTFIDGVQVHQLVGCGQMSEVWLGFDTRLDRDVALRVLRPEWTQNAVLVARFQRIANVISQFSHPNITSIYRTGIEDNLFYYVLEWVRGGSLAHKVKRKGAFPLSAAVNVMLQMIDPLSRLWPGGVIHGSIKPQNILFTREGTVKLSEFALARVARESMSVKDPRFPVGGAETIAPEAATGNRVDNRSDMYSLGICFYYMLTGELPFQGQTAREIMARHIQDPLPESPVLAALHNGDVMRILNKMTAKDPADRYAEYEDLILDLRTLQIDPAQGSSIFNTTDTRTGERPVEPEWVPPLNKADTQPIESETLILPAHDVTPAAEAPAIFEPHAEEAITGAPLPATASLRRFNPRAIIAAAAACGVLAGGWYLMQRRASSEPPGAAAEDAKTRTPATAAAPTPALQISQPSASPTAGLPNLTSVLATSAVATTPAPGGAFPAEIIVDDADASKLILSPRGDWKKWDNSRESYGHSSHVVKVDGTVKIATFLASVPQQGQYRLYLSWVSSKEFRSPAVPVYIHTANGLMKTEVDQVNTDSTFVYLGSFTFPSGQDQPIATVSTEGLPPTPTTFVSVDALKLVKE